MVELSAEYRRGDDTELGIELLGQLLTALLIRIARLLPRADAGSPPVGAETFRRFQHELERSFAVTRHAGDYAARVGYSVRTLSRACQAVTGHTAKELINARVALEAKRLLTHTDLPAATVGRRLGFTEPTNFNKFFTRETGHNPGDFRSTKST